MTIIAPTAYFGLGVPGMPGPLRSDLVRLLSALLELAHKPERPLALSFAMSGFLFEELMDKERDILRRLAAAVHDGRLEVIASFPYEPDLSLCLPEDLEQQASVCEQMWRSIGITEAPRGHWIIENKWCEILERFFSNRRFDYVLGSCRLLEDTSPPGVFSNLCASDLQGSSHTLIVQGLEGEPADEVLKLCKSDAAPSSLVLHDLLTLYRSDTGNPNLAIDSALQLISSLQSGSSVLTFETLTKTLEAAANEQALPAKILRPLSKQSAFFFSDPEADRRLNCRIEETRRLLQPLPELIEQSPMSYANRDRYRDACRSFQKSLYRPRVEGTAVLSVQAQFHARRRAYRGLLEAQVLIDMIKYPEIDPVSGWIDRELSDIEGRGEKEIIFDTPFLRYYFKCTNGGHLSELDYKPRRLNLSDISCGSQAIPNFAGYLVPTEGLADYPLFPDPAEEKLIRRQRDMMVQRFIQPLKAQPPGSAFLYRDFIFKAGLGGHLLNSTCGFSLEYWIEADSDDPELRDQLIVLECSLIMPTGDERVLSAKSLHCVGGVSERSVPLSLTQRFKGEDEPGGLYGVRIIDGLDSFVVEIRSAKNLAEVECTSLETAFVGNSESVHEDEELRNYGGTRIRFITPAKSVMEDHQRNTLFVSIG